MLHHLINKHRLAHGWSRAEMARQLHVTRSHISAIENGTRNPSPELLVKMTKLFTWSVSDWIDLYLISGPSPLNLCRLAEHLLDYGLTEPAETVAQTALHMSRSQYDGRYNSYVYHALGKIHVKKQDFQSAYFWFSQMLAALTRTPISFRKAIALYNCGLTAALAGHDHVASLHFIRKARNIFEELNRQKEYQLSWYTEGQVLLELHNYHEAWMAFNVVHDLRDHPSLGYEVQLGQLICRWAIHGPETVLTAMKRLQRATTSFPNLQGRLLHNLGVLYRQTGNLTDAEITIRDALTMHRMPSTRQYAASLAEKCLIEGLSEKWDQAAKTYEKFRCLTHQRDILDFATMATLGRIHRWPRLQDEPMLSLRIGDNYERRFSAAWQLLIRFF
ncbi:helix-turn-helix transcriptional regulator [Sulfobacillus thermosulfidooxidans]|uniref:helix-turn-helix transcriptional regulator n=1 Tax=Sulfobacillus thermosulfidooxidans TaxID=28034 RepID=UPI0006B5F3A9|nr:helix-turn-helix transcriptional regulator [Sulfobacillus thermosulfidooxidans]